MNQQSGMEADKEIDRFLQKVKKSPVGRCAHGLGAHPQGFYVV